MHTGPGRIPNKYESNEGKGGFPYHFSGARFFLAIYIPIVVLHPPASESGGLYFGETCPHKGLGTEWPDYPECRVGDASSDTS